MTDGDRARSSSNLAQPIGRRSFLAGLGGGAMLGATGFHAAPASAAASHVSPSGQPRQVAAYRLRCDMARLALDRPLAEQEANGEERDYPYVASFSKGLPHDALGEVDPNAYRQLLHALDSGEHEVFEEIRLGGVRKLRNPQAGNAFDLEGPDSHHLTIDPAPRIDSAEGAADQAELYWMALARDVRFRDYETSPIAARAADDLSQLGGFQGPRQSGVVTPATLFRGMTRGDVTGPYVSQFLLRDIPYGSLTISQRQLTTLPNIDYMTDASSWLAIQRGKAPAVVDALDPVRRHIRNGRDLAAYVHLDALYEAYLNACLILLARGAPEDAGNPYVHATRTDGFATFGEPHILSLVTEVATRALKAVWFQKWYVHRRLRPEAFGGRVHHHRTGTRSYPLHSDLLDSRALDETFSRTGTYFLPQAYPEGSPLHPSYGAGHATVAGACVTILKAWFDESYVLPDPMVASADGLGLEPYTGADAGRLTVGGELDKLAANVAMGRNFAGIHYRSDYSESLLLGEEIAIGILEEQRPTYEEHGRFHLTLFDGTEIEI